MSELVRRLKDLNLGNDKKDEIGIAYLTHIIGAKKTTIDSYLDPSQPGLSVHCFGCDKKEDYRLFWKEINVITGNVYSEEELTLLIKNSSSYSIFEIIFELSPSKVIDKLVRDAIANK